MARHDAAYAQLCLPSALADLATNDPDGSYCDSITAQLARHVFVTPKTHQVCWR